MWYRLGKQQKQNGIQQWNAGGAGNPLYSPSSTLFIFLKNVLPYVLPMGI
jgi:hypothetical protein